MAITEVAVLPATAEKTVYDIARVDERPALKIEGLGRIERTEPDQLVDAQRRGGASD